VAIRAIIGVAVGLVIIWGGGSELLAWWRARRRLQRVTGVIVAREEFRDIALSGQGPLVRSRAARFRFSTDEGQLIEAVSAKSSFLGPRPGKQVSVLYDPADPQNSAEIAGVMTLKVLLSPALIVGGAILAGFSLTRL